MTGNGGRVGLGRGGMMGTMGMTGMGGSVGCGSVGVDDTGGGDSGGAVSRSRRAATQGWLDNNTITVMMVTNKQAMEAMWWDGKLQMQALRPTVYL